MRKLLLIALIAGALAYHRFATGRIDGTAWEVRVKTDSIFAFSHPDTLIFQAGHLTVVGYIPSGFAAAKYETLPDDATPGLRFKAALEHDEKGTYEWTGRVDGDKIEGVVLWHDFTGKTKRYKFKGSKKTA